MAKLLTKKQIIEDVCNSVQSEFNISSVAHLNDLSVSARCSIEYCDPSVTLSDSTMYELILDTTEPKLYHVDFTNIKNFDSTNDYNSVAHFYVELSIETAPETTEPVDDVYIYVRDDHKRPINMMATIGEEQGWRYFANGIIYYLVDGDVIHLQRDTSINKTIGHIVQHGELRKDLCNMETYVDASLTACRKIKLKDKLLPQQQADVVYSYYIPASKSERVAYNDNMELVTREGQHILFDNENAQQTYTNFFIGKVIRETGRLREYDSSVYHYDASTLNYTMQRQQIEIEDNVIQILPAIRKEDVSTTAALSSGYSMVDRAILTDDSTVTTTTTISVEDKLIKK